MTYIIYKDGAEINRIVADEAFVQQYYSNNGYSYEIEPIPTSTTPEESEVASDPFYDEIAQAIADAINKI